MKHIHHNNYTLVINNILNLKYVKKNDCIVAVVHVNKTPLEQTVSGVGTLNEFHMLDLQTQIWKSSGLNCDYSSTAGM